MGSLLLELLPSIVGFSALLAASAFFSGSETALFSLGELDLDEMEQDDSPRARRAAALVRRPHRTLVTLLLCNMVVNVALSVVATSLLMGLLGDAGLGVAIAVVSILLVLFGEIIPKTLGLRQGRRAAVVAADPITMLTKVLGPVGRGLEAMAVAASGPVRGGPLGREELTTLVDVAREEGSLAPFEGRVLARILRFSDISVERALTPRVEMVALAVETPLEEVAATFEQSGRSRLPVFEGDRDHIVGVLLLKDFLTRDPHGVDLSVRSLMREPFFVPESLGAHRLFREFQARRTHIAVVVGEHGGVEGLVTLEDLLEELIGDIHDETDELEVSVVELSSSSWRVDAGIELDDLGEVIGLELSFDGEEAVTLAGWLEDELGRVPQAGDTALRGDFSFRVLRALPTRPLLVSVERQGGVR